MLQFDPGDECDSVSRHTTSAAVSRCVWCDIMCCSSTQEMNATVCLGILLLLLFLAVYGVT